MSHITALSRLKRDYKSEPGATHALKYEDERTCSAFGSDEPTVRVARPASSRKDTSMAQAAFANAAETEAARLKSAVADALEDGVHAARRAMKHGLSVAEEMMDDAAHEVKRHPLPVVASTSVLSFAAGVVVGWLLFGLRKR